MVLIDLYKKSAFLPFESVPVNRSIPKALAPFMVPIKKIVFGTDTSEVSLCCSQMTDLMDYLHIEQEAREKFWWRNAAEIFGL